MKWLTWAGSPPALNAHASKLYVVLGLSPVILALNGTYVVPAPTSFIDVSVGRKQLKLLVLYWNQACVSNPFGFTVSLNVAVLLVTADAEGPFSEGVRGARS